MSSLSLPDLLAVGESVGDTVGDNVGETVGDKVGESVDDTVGDNVGLKVGEAVDLLPSFLSLELLKEIMLINNEQSK